MNALISIGLNRIEIPAEIPHVFRHLRRPEAAALTLFSPMPDVSFLISSVALEEVNGRDAYLYCESVRVGAALVIAHGLASPEQTAKIKATLEWLATEDSDFYGD